MPCTSQILAHRNRQASVQSEGKDSDAVVLGCWPPVAGSQQYNRQARPRLPLPQGMPSRQSPSQFLRACAIARQLRPVGRNPSNLIALATRSTFSSQGKTARTKPSAGLGPLRSSSEPDHPCIRSFFAALGLCTRHKKVPPQHLASTCHQDHPRPVPVRVS